MALLYDPPAGNPNSSLSPGTPSPASPYGNEQGSALWK